MQKISIFIICKNEEEKIEACLIQASKLADEIIVVDSGSTDQTIEICKKYTDKVFHQDWLGFGKQKNIALEKCSYEWVLNLDADEILSDELINEIQAIDLKNQAKAYLFARKLFIGKQKINFGGFYPDYQLRLFQKSQGRFCHSAVHESVELKNDKGEYDKNRIGLFKFKNPILHYAYRNIEELENSFLKYAKLSSKKKNPFKALLSAAYVFCFKYFIRLGFLDGINGLRLALINSKYNLQKYM